MRRSVLLALPLVVAAPLILLIMAMSTVSPPPVPAGCVTGTNPTGSTGTATIVQANLPSKTGYTDLGAPGIRLITADHPDVITLNEQAHRSLTSLTSAAPGYAAYRDTGGDPLDAGDGAPENVVMWDTIRWTKTSAGRERLITQQMENGVVRSRYATWVTLQSTTDATATLAVIATHMPVNPQGLGGNGPILGNRAASYNHGMNNLVALINTLQAQSDTVLVGGDFNTHPDQTQPWSAVSHMTAAGYDFTTSPTGGIDYVFFPSSAALLDHHDVASRNTSDHPFFNATTVSADGDRPHLTPSAGAAVGAKRAMVPTDSSAFAATDGLQLNAPLLAHSRALPLPGLAAARGTRRSDARGAIRSPDDAPDTLSTSTSTRDSTFEDSRSTPSTSPSGGGPAPPPTTADDTTLEAATQAAAAAYQAGFRGDDLITAVAIAGVESTWNPRAVTGTHYGLWQISADHRGLTPGWTSTNDILVPTLNASYAYALYQRAPGSGDEKFRDWLPFEQLEYHQDLPLARQAVDRATNVSGCGTTSAGTLDRLSTELKARIEAMQATPDGLCALPWTKNAPCTYDNQCPKVVDALYGGPGTGRGFGNGQDVAQGIINAGLAKAQGTGLDPLPPPGAVVSYNTGNGTGHVAIYVGNGRIFGNDYGCTSHGIYGCVGFSDVHTPGGSVTWALPTHSFDLGGSP